MGGGPSSWLTDEEDLPLCGGNTGHCQSWRLSESRDNQLSGTPPRVTAFLLTMAVIHARFPKLGIIKHIQVVCHH